MNRTLLPAAFIAGLSVLGAAPHHVPKPAGNPPPGGSSLEFLHLLGDPTFKHANSPTHVQPLPQNRLLTSSEDGSARIWDLATGRELARFSHGNRRVWNAIALPGGKVATASDTVCIWDVESGEQRHCLEHKENAFRLAVIPGTSHLASGHDGSVILIRDWQSGALIRELAYAKDEVYTLVAPSASRLIAAGDDGVIQLWDLASGDELKKVELDNEPRISTISLSPDRERVLVSAGSKLLCLSAADLSTVWGIDLGRTSYVTSWSPDGARAALCSGSQLRTIETKSGEEVWTKKLPHGSHRPVSYSLDGGQIFSGGDELIYRFAAEDGQQLYPPPELAYALGDKASAAFSADGALAFSGSLDGFIYPFETATGKALPPKKTAHASALLQLSPAGELYAADTSGTISRIKNDGDGEFVALPGIASFSDLALGAEDVLVIGDSNGIKRLRNSKMLGFLGGEKSGYESVSASADGSKVATASEETGPVQIWSPATGNLLRTIANEVDSPDGITLFHDGLGVVLFKDEELFSWFERDVKPLDANAAAEIQGLFAKLSSDGFAERARARQALIALGPSAISLIEAKRAKSPDVGLQLAQVLHQLRRLLGGDLTKSLTLADDITDFAASPDGRHWAATLGSGHTTQLVFGRYASEDGTFEVLQSFSAPNSAGSVIFSPDGQLLLTGNRTASSSLYRIVAASE